MKFYGAFVLSVVCLLSGCSQAEVTREEMEEVFRAVSQKCKEDVGASDADIEALVRHEIETSQPGKCLRACLMLKFGVMSEENKVVPDKMLKVADFLVQSDPVKMKIADEVIQQCAPTTDSDKCEASYKIMKCIAESAKAKGASVQF